jgi:hypothetical protein
MPFHGVPLPITKIVHQLKEAKKVLKASQVSSQDLRYRCYTDLLATYANDHNSSTSRDSERKARIVTNTIKSEQCRAIFSNIRTTVKPGTNGSLNRLHVPRHRATSDYPDNFQDFLATHNDPDIVWDSLLDKSSIDKHLLRFNRQHFRAAATSPCGNGIIHDQLSFSSLSPDASALLSGTIPTNWHGNDNLLREFLTSFIIPESTKHLPQIETSITHLDVQKVSRNGRRRRRHLHPDGILVTTRPSFSTTRSYPVSQNFSILSLTMVSYSQGGATQFAS